MLQKAASMGSAPPVARRGGESPSPQLSWPLVSGAFLAIGAGYVSLIVGTWWIAVPLVIAPLMVLMHGHDRRGLKSINLAVGRAVYRRVGGLSEKDPWDPHDPSSQRERTNDGMAQVVPLRRESFRSRHGAASGSGARASSKDEGLGRAVEEEQRCPKCQRVAMQWSENGYYCDICALPFPGSA